MQKWCIWTDENFSNLLGEILITIMRYETFSITEATRCPISEIWSNREHQTMKFPERKATSLVDSWNLKQITKQHQTTETKPTKGSKICWSACICNQREINIEAFCFEQSNIDKWRGLATVRMVFGLYLMHWRPKGAPMIVYGNHSMFSNC